MLTETQAPLVWPANASIEQRFVFAMTGNQDSQREKEWRALLLQVNWPRLLESTRPDMYPYLHYCLEARAPAGSCPAKVLGHLRARRRLTAARNLRMISELRSIQAALANQDIPILALKGIALAVSAYPDASLRPMNDMDLLIQRQDLDTATQILNQQGYRCPARFRGYSFEGEIKLEKPGTPVLLEMHTQIEITAPASAEHPDRIWERSVEIATPHLTIRIPSEQDFLFHLCTHAARRHCFSTGLLPLVDVMRWIEWCGGAWGWPSLQRDADARGFGPYLEATLDLVRDLLGAPIPVPATTHLDDKPAVREMAWHQISREWRSDNIPPRWIRELLSAKPAARLETLMNHFRRQQGPVTRPAGAMGPHVLSAVRNLLRTLKIVLSRSQLQHWALVEREREKLASLLKDRASRSV
jgi:hypothetical protein